MVETMYTHMLNKLPKATNANIKCPIISEIEIINKICLKEFGQEPLPFYNGRARTKRSMLNFLNFCRFELTFLRRQRELRHQHRHENFKVIK